MPHTRTLVIRALIALAIAHGAAAQTAPTVVISPVPKLAFFDNNGKPLAGGCVATYQAGTTTPLQTFTDATGMVPNPNPVMLDASGRAAIWINVNAIKYVVKAKSTACSLSAGTVLYTTDNVQDSGMRLRSDLAAPGGAGNIGYQPPGGTVPITIAGAIGAIGVLDLGYSSLTSACSSASGATAPLLVSKAWTLLATQTLACAVSFVPGGTIQPAAGATVTLPANTACPAFQKCYDISLGGTIKFPVPPASVTPYNFGAKGDGAADDTAALQASLKSVAVGNSRGGMLRVPYGRFMVSAPVTIPNYVTMKCDNMDGSFIVAASGFAPSTGAAVIVLADIPGSMNEASSTNLDGCFIDAAGNADYGVYSANLQEGSGIHHSGIFGWNLYGVYLSGGYCQNYSLDDLWVIGFTTSAPVPARKAVYLTGTASSNTVTRVTAVPNSGNGGPYGAAFSIASGGIVLTAIHAESALDGIYVEPNAGAVNVIGYWAHSSVTNTIHIGAGSFASTFMGISQNGSPNGIVDDNTGLTTLADGTPAYFSGIGGIFSAGPISTLNAIGMGNIAAANNIGGLNVKATQTIHALGNQPDTCGASVPLCAVGNSGVTPVATVSNTAAGATPAGSSIMQIAGTNGTDAGPSLKVVNGGAQAQAIVGVPGVAGGGGLYLCVDSTGTIYKKATCP